MYVLCVCKGLHMLLCLALSMQTMLNKQSINIHAKAYKSNAIQSKALIYMQTMLNTYKGF
ncbi:hypothetical protein C826_02317 [Helicobacter bilis WiWa]|uniref:Uncharacterized protein n=1 Tax=Helicobacter bilis WiWa TaxID=1235804 RepID=N2BJB5_9HELI|nr:hypothetical protein [Helicobacter bilis]EMZ36919.1 hypothetical protein C826_02317 [Helicobacter bilis WiWa]